MIRALAAAALLASVSAPALAQNSAPAQTAPYPNTIPDARDIPIRAR